MIMSNSLPTATNYSEYEMTNFSARRQQELSFQDRQFQNARISHRSAVSRNPLKVKNPYEETHETVMNSAHNLSASIVKNSKIMTKAAKAIGANSEYRSLNQSKRVHSVYGTNFRSQSAAMGTRKMGQSTNSFGTCSSQSKKNKGIKSDTPVFTVTSEYIPDKDKRILVDKSR